MANSCMIKVSSPGQLRSNKVGYGFKASSANRYEILASPNVEEVDESCKAPVRKDPEVEEEVSGEIDEDTETSDKEEGTTEVDDDAAAEAENSNVGDGECDIEEVGPVAEMNHGRVLTTQHLDCGLEEHQMKKTEDSKVDAHQVFAQKPLPVAQSDKNSLDGWFKRTVEVSAQGEVKANVTMNEAIVAQRKLGGISDARAGHKVPHPFQRNRGGFCDRARDVFDEKPSQPGPKSWASLLTKCSSLGTCLEYSKKGLPSMRIWLILGVIRLMMKSGFPRSHRNLLNMQGFFHETSMCKLNVPQVKTEENEVLDDKVWSQLCRVPLGEGKVNYAQQYHLVKAQVLVKNLPKEVTEERSREGI
ncbi:hypothetical protein U1Q18_049519 [Sarracenia purpurea var. burkii]